jgi:methionyl-tRNA formyltransferase
MRVVVMAYQDIGWVCLDELLALGADVRLVVTHRDQPGETIWFRSVAERASRAGLPLLVPDAVNAAHVVEAVARAQPEVLFSFYVREILGAELLALPSRGALNLHGSLLPRYRGRCPVNWVLVHGERETGVTLHYMEAKPDRGDIVAQRAVPIADDDTALTLNRKLGDAARLLLRETYPLLVAGTAPRRPQDHAGASYFGGRRPEDGRIHWDQPARRIYDLVRAVTAPYPGAFTTWDGERLLVWSAHALAGAPEAAPGTVLDVRPGEGAVVATGTGALVLERVQLGRGPEQRADEVVGLVQGVRLGDAARTEATA